MRGPPQPAAGEVRRHGRHRGGGAGARRAARQVRTRSRGLQPDAAGLRLAWQQAESNFGLIPLVNKGIVDIGEATWFVEAAFPTFYANDTVALNMVLHSGIGF